MEEILTIKYKSESLEIEFKGNLEDGLKLLAQLEPPRFIIDIDSEANPMKIVKTTSIPPKGGTSAMHKYSPLFRNKND